jgi:hypothetical protein
MGWVVSGFTLVRAPNKLTWNNREKFHSCVESTHHTRHSQGSIACTHTKTPEPR